MIFPYTKSNKSLYHLDTGFTLIELLVVIAIIGILASVVLVSLNGALAKGRDSKRVSELRSLQTALELYANDHNGAYPGSGHYISNSSCAVAVGTPVWTTIFDSTFQNLYIKQIPVDPSGPNDPKYCYTYTSFPLTGVNYTGWQCTLPDGTVVDPDGMNGTIQTGRGYSYLISFQAETDQSSAFLKFNSSGRYCILGPAR